MFRSPRIALEFCWSIHARRLTLQLNVSLGRFSDPMEAWLSFWNSYNQKALDFVTACKYPSLHNSALRVNDQVTYMLPCSSLKSLQPKRERLQASCRTCSPEVNLSTMDSVIRELCLLTNCLTKAQPRLLARRNSRCRYN